MLCDIREDGLESSFSQDMRQCTPGDAGAFLCTTQACFPCACVQPADRPGTEGSHCLCPCHSGQPRPRLRLDGLRRRGEAAEIGSAAPHTPLTQPPPHTRATTLLPPPRVHARRQCNRPPAPVLSGGGWPAADALLLSCRPGVIQSPHGSSPTSQERSSSRGSMETTGG